MPTGLNSWESKVDRLHVDKFVPAPADLSQLCDVVKNVVNKTEFDELVKKVNAIENTETSNLVKKPNVLKLEYQSVRPTYCFHA